MDDELIRRAFAQAQAEQWEVTLQTFADAVRRGAVKAAIDVSVHLEGLHLEDLALACACAEGRDAAWDHFVLTYRPVLYRTADALDRTGAARELADALYAELYGLKTPEGERRSLFRYFHGRSSLATWLRALLSQRFIDHIRANRRFQPVPEDDGLTPALPTASASPADPDAPRLAQLMKQALGDAIASLAPRDRLRLGCYYSQAMTLAQIGRLTGDHEATVSRQLAKTRRAIREFVEQSLRRDHGLGDREIRECFTAMAGDAGDLDLSQILPSPSARKNSTEDRSTSVRGNAEDPPL